MKKSKPPLPFIDYERIFQVLYTFLKTADGYLHRGCKFYATAGAYLLHEHYKLDANAVFGAAASHVSDADDQVLYFGRVEDNAFASDEMAFHAWVECEGYLIDFMAPMFPEAARDAGGAAKLSRRMFQKPLALDAPAVDHLARVGDFCVSPNPELTFRMLRDFIDRPDMSDLVKAATAYYRKPPKVMDRGFRLFDTKVGAPVPLAKGAPNLSGVW